jgi:hypothetical protein
MIRENFHNTAWWGKPVAVVEDAAFFALEPAARQAALRDYAWAEFKSPLASAPPFLQMAGSGFTLVDVQVGFRLMLGAVRDSPSLADLVCQFANQTHFEVGLGETRKFEHERYLQIPGAGQERLAQRYERWSNQLVREQPEWCLRVLYQGQVQGWFLASMTGQGLYLALAMLSKTAQVSGLHLYQKAIHAYAAKGARIGFASFSVRNTAVLNIYSQLGARFTPVTGIWLWCSAGTSAPEYRS